MATNDNGSATGHPAGHHRRAARREKGTTVFRTARTTRRVFTRTTAAVFASATLLLAGCGAGQYAQSVNEQAAMLGANGEVGDMSALNVRLAKTDREKYPAGSNPRVLLYLSNDGINPDTLTSVSTSAAQSVQITGDPIIPAQTLVDLSGDSGKQIVIQGLNQDLYYGVSIPMTFSFANAGDLTINVPIENPTDRSQREIIEIQPPHPTPIWEEGSEGGAAQGAAAEEGGSEASTSTAATDANQGGNVEGQGSSSAAATETATPTSGAQGSGTVASTSTAATDANQGGNVEGAPSSTAGTAVSGG